MKYKYLVCFHNSPLFVGTYEEVKMFFEDEVEWDFKSHYSVFEVGVGDMDD